MMILKYGSRGSLVELLQLGLSRAGYGPLDIDGCLGSETAAALGAFRRARGLPESAEVLPSVWAALELSVGYALSGGGLLVCLYLWKRAGAAKGSGGA